MYIMIKVMYNKGADQTDLRLEGSFMHSIEQVSYYQEQLNTSVYLNVIGMGPLISM